MSRTTVRASGTSARWLVGFAAAWVLLAVLGRLLVVGEAALVWPALGLSITWFLVRRASFVSVDTAVLAVAAFATIALVGAPLGVAALGGLTNGFQAPLAALLVRRWLPALDPATGVAGLDSPRAVLHFGGAVLLPATLGSVVALAGLAVLGDPVSVGLGLLLVGRNLCGGLLAATLTLTLVAPVLARRRPRFAGWPVTIETLLALAVALGVLLVDAVYVDAPVGFLVLAVAVWVGARGSVVANVWFSSALGACVVLATLAGEGTFSSSSSQSASLIAQLFTVLVFGAGLALATGRVETERLQSALHDAALEAAYRAEFLDLTMATVHEGIMVVDADRAITLVNPDAVRLLGVDEREDGPHLPAFDTFIVDGTHLEEVDRPLARALRGEDVRDVEAFTSIEPPRVLSVSARPMRSTAGPTRHAVLTVRDVTSEHVQATALRTFAGVVAHDLQNPLAAINGWTTMLAEHLLDTHPGDQEALSHLSRITTSSARMSSLIAELLAYATVKDKELDPQPVDLATIVTAIAQERGRTDQISCGPVPLTHVDATLIYQLFDNLIGNAVKFVAPGVEPRVVVEAAPVAGRPELVTIEVHDNGIGIPAALQEAVFSEFRRAPGSTHSGHGLGLAICRQIVARHGGTITVHDRADGTGSTFRLTLPRYGDLPLATAPAARLATPRAARVVDAPDLVSSTSD